MKLSDTIDYNRKSNYYKNVNNQFSIKAPPEILRENYLPDWNNDALWDKHYQNQIIEKGLLKGRVTSPKSFRDYCYDEATKSAKQNFGNCNSSSGWCMDCVRGKSWSK